MTVIAPAGLVMWRAVQLGQSFHLQHSPLFVVLLLFTMLERLTSFASDVAIERDWLTKLVGKCPFAAESMALHAFYACNPNRPLCSRVHGIARFSCLRPSQPLCWPKA